jgi:hypothetical protein
MRHDEVEFDGAAGEVAEQAGRSTRTQEAVAAKCPPLHLNVVSWLASADVVDLD